MMKNGLLDLVFFWSTSPSAMLQYFRITLSERMEGGRDTVSEILLLLIVSPAALFNGAQEMREK